MSNQRTRMRDYQQQYYGGYCNKCRESSMQPLSYTKFKEVLDKALTMYEFKKDIMNYLIEVTIMSNWEELSNEKE